MAWKPEEALDVEAVWDMAVVECVKESKVVLRVKVGTRRVNPVQMLYTASCQASHQGDGDRRCTRVIDAQINARTTYPLPSRATLWALYPIYIFLEVMCIFRGKE